MNEYIKEKVKLLNELGFHKVKKSDFSDCTTEIQVDNRAREIILA